MTPDSAPYPGLRSFRPEEADWFFGRDECIDSMVDRLARTHFLAVVGSSGSGKSSLVKTGLLRHLEMGLIPKAGSNWRVVDFRPGGSPLRNLAAGLLRIDHSQAPTDQSRADADLLRAFLAHGPRSVIEWCKAGDLPKDSNLLLLVDQFEELFRYEDYEGREEAEAFVALLIESAHSSEFPIYVTLTMRSEFLGACSLIEGLAEEINAGMFLTPRMTRDQCREAIVGPAGWFGFKIDDALVVRLLNDLANFAPWDDSSRDEQLDRIARRADQLPLLQYTLNRMWRLARDKAGKEPTVLRLADYESEEIGGLAGALNAQADEILGKRQSAGGAKLEKDDWPVVEAVFRALTIGSTVAEAVRRPTRFRDLIAICGGDEEAVRKVVDVFRAPGCNFLVPESDVFGKLSFDTFIDISHESLIRQWKEFSGWLTQEADAARRWRRLLERQSDGDLLRGKELADLIALRREQRPNWAWAARYDDTLVGRRNLSAKEYESIATQRFADAMKFLSRSEKEEQSRLEAEKRREEEIRQREIRDRQRRFAFRVVSSAFVISALFLIWALIERNNAKKNADNLLAALSENATFVSEEYFARAIPKQLALQLLENTEKALRNLQEDAGTKHVHVRTLDAFSEAFLIAGNATVALKCAEEEFRIARELTTLDPENGSWQFDLASGYRRIGDARLALGDLDSGGSKATGTCSVAELDPSKRNTPATYVAGAPTSASEAFEKFLEVMLVLAAKDGTNDLWQRGLSKAYDGIGDVLFARNLADDALKAFTKKGEIADLNVKRNQSKDESARRYWSWDKAVSELNIGDVQLSKGTIDGEHGARRHFAEAKKIFEGLATDRFPRWKWNLGLAHRRLGDLSMKEGNPEAALEAYDQYFQISTALVAQDESNSDWQHHLVLANERMGDALIALIDKSGDAGGRLKRALEHYTKANEIAEKFLNEDPSDKRFLQNLAISEERLGDVLLARGDLAGARERYAKYQERACALVQEDRANAFWLRDLAISHQRNGQVLLMQNDRRAAYGEFQRCSEIFASNKKLRDLYDPRNAKPLNVDRYCEKEIAQLAREFGTTPPTPGCQPKKN